MVSTNYNAGLKASLEKLKSVLTFSSFYEFSPIFTRKGSGVHTAASGLKKMVQFSRRLGMLLLQSLLTHRRMQNY